MAPRCQLAVPGGTAHVFPRTQLDALQSIVTDLGADTFPLFLRLGSTPRWRMQPVTARQLLAEVEKFRRMLHLRLIPGLSLRDSQGDELGAMFMQADERPLITGERLTVTPAPEGIRVVMEGFPPPAGFRSRPGLPPVHYECYFTELRTSPEGWVGLRTPDMGGSGAPVALPAITLPPATRWDYAKAAGRPAIDAVVYIEPPATEVFRDLLHALDAAGNESLRLKAPLEFRRDA